MWHVLRYAIGLEPPLSGVWVFPWPNWIVYSFWTCNVIAGFSFLVATYLLFQIFARQGAPPGRAGARIAMFLTACSFAFFLQAWTLAHHESVLTAFAKMLTTLATVGLAFWILQAFSRQQKAEVSIHARERRFRNLVESLWLMVFITDEHGKVTYLSHRWHEYLGIPYEQGALSDWRPFIHHDDLPGFKAALAKCRQTLEPFNAEYRLKRHDGSYRWHVAHAIPAIDQKGRVYEWVGSVTDVEDLRRATEDQIRARRRLEESEGRSRRLFESNILGVVYFHTDGRILNCNGAFLKMMEYDERDLREGKLNWRDFTPAEWAAADDWAVRELRASRLFTPFEKECISKNGGRLPIYLGGALFDGSDTEGVCWVIDLTERKKIESELRLNRERFDLAIQSTGVGVWFTDVPTGKSSGNAKVRQHFWLPAEEDLDFTNFAGRIHQEDRLRVEQARREAMAGMSDYDVKYRVVHPKNGETRWIKAFGKSYRDEKGNISRFDGITLDITAQMAAEQDLREALQVRDEFLSIASHELRTPLTSMKLQIQGFKREAERSGMASLTPERMHKMLEQSDRQILRLTRLIDDMLDISRINTGRLTLRTEKLDLSTVVRDAAERIAPLMERAHCELHQRLQPGVFGHGDRYRLEQVVSNLLTNACRHGHGRPIDLEVAEVSGKARILVADRGNGIALADQDRIFRRFERGISSAEGSGLGLGLYIVRQIVEMHGGTVTVQSDLGRGAAFSVVLPLAPVTTGFAHA